MTTADRREQQPATAVLALGSNVGARQAHLSSALADLSSSQRSLIQSVSPVIESPALKFDPAGDAFEDPNGPPYINGVVIVATALALDRKRRGVP